MNPRDVKKQAAKFLPTSVISILGPSPNFTILSTAVRPNGTPVIQLSDGLAHSYDAALCAWTKLSEPWSGGTRAALEGAHAAGLAALNGTLASRRAVTPRLALPPEVMRHIWHIYATLSPPNFTLAPRRRLRPQVG